MEVVLKAGWVAFDSNSKITVLPTQFQVLIDQSSLCYKWHNNDLRLLDGDLDCPTQMMPVVSDILANIQKCEWLAYANVQLLLAGHALGKTKATFDVARERFTILLDICQKEIEQHGKSSI